MSTSKPAKIDTKLIYIGRDPKNYDGMVNIPIYKTSTKIYQHLPELWQDEREMHTSISYGRTGTPTVAELENAMAELDGAEHGIATASGMSAIAICLYSLLQKGDHLLISDAVYKCTRRFVDEELSKAGISVTYFDPADLGQIENLIQPNSKLIFFESPGSGTMEIIDTPQLVNIAKKHKLITAMDNSWATAALFRPFDFGVNVVVQSLTKYISGHSDYFAGMITCNSNTYKQLYQTAVNFGACPTPENCYMALRGLRTLYCRLKQQEESALKIAKWLALQPKVTSVIHPALEQHPNHDIWLRDFKGASGLFSITVEFNEEELIKFYDGLQFFALGLSWGGFESLILPYKISGIRTVTKNLLNKQYYLRISIGLENSDDLIADLQQAFELIGKV
jgi:cystathionine beta-lyase